MTLPDGTSVTLAYDSVNGRHDNRLSRLGRVNWVGRVVVGFSSWPPKL